MRSWRVRRVRLVPAMEWFDDALAAIPLAHVGDAFGGSLLLGLTTTLFCAAFVAAIFYALRDGYSRIAISSSQSSRRCCAAINRHRSFFCTEINLRGLHRQSSSPVALSLAKRGPPVASFTI